MRLRVFTCRIQSSTTLFCPFHGPTKAHAPLQAVNGKMKYAPKLVAVTEQYCCISITPFTSPSRHGLTAAFRPTDHSEFIDTEDCVRRPGLSAFVTDYRYTEL